VKLYLAAAAKHLARARLGGERARAPAESELHALRAMAESTSQVGGPWASPDHPREACAPATELSRVHRR
jgi:hypothetical protein